MVSVPQTAFLLATLTVANSASTIAFGMDKLMSIKGGWRVPESTLLAIAFFGPFGAYACMLIFRHKTRKPKFLLVPAFLIVQLCLLVYIILA
ncbi:MAG TPA: DUF1294 domain-containing protein [Candidatus Methanomethylicus sp.]|nr:DUF1294 domain-containing protein [Candidatus Methanomethylicus sp.]